MRLLPVTIAGTLLLASCGAYDDGGLSNRLSSLEARVDSLETSMINGLNDQISGIRTIVSAIRANIFISLYEESGKAVTIELTDGTVMRFATDVSDAEGPVISVRLGEDGHWYWTLDGELLLASDGKPVRADDEAVATGPHGLDGLSPTVSVENGHWFLTYGDRKEDLGAVAGTRLPSVFDGVIPGEGEVTFVLKDGSRISLPRVDGFSINLSGQQFKVTAGGSCDVSYTYSCSDPDAELTVLSGGGISSRVIPAEKRSGIIRCEFGEDFVSGEVTVILVDSFGDSIFKAIHFSTL